MRALIRRYCIARSGQNFGKCYGNSGDVSPKNVADLSFTTIHFKIKISCSDTYIGYLSCGKCCTDDGEQLSL